MVLSIFNDGHIFYQSSTPTAGLRDLRKGNMLDSNKITPSASISLKYKGKVFSANSTGDGPVDACYKAMEKVTGIKPNLLSYNLGAVTAGKDALGEVSVRMEIGKRSVGGRGASTDVVEASIKAYLDALNKFKALGRK